MRWFWTCSQHGMGCRSFGRPTKYLIAVRLPSAHRMDVEGDTSALDYRCGGVMATIED